MGIIKRIFFFTLCGLFFACKKDTTLDTPSVQIIAPVGLQTFNVFDTIIVQAHVSDADGLKSVNISLTNDQSVQVLGAVTVNITSNSMTFNWPYILSDIHLASGQYYITVTASNGTNSFSAYQKVYVNAVPTKRVTVYAFTRNAGSVQVWQIDSLFHLSSGPLIQGNFSASDVSSYYQQVYIAAFDTGSVNALAFPSNGTLWQVPGIDSPTPYFTNVYSYGDAAYLSLYGGYIKYYNHQGAVQLSVSTGTQYYPIKTFVWNNYIFAEEKNLSSSAENLVLYFASSGMGYQQIVLLGPVIAMYGMDNNDVFVFGNQTSGGPYMEDYNVSGNIFYAPYSLPSAKLLSVVQLNSNQYLLGFNNSTIYQYTYNPVNFLTYISGVNASHMKYDAVNNQLIVTSNKTVQEYNCGISSGTLVYSTSLPDSALDVQILFNK